jgi:hypothetical protein
VAGTPDTGITVGEVDDGASPVGEHLADGPTAYVGP